MLEGGYHFILDLEGCEAGILNDKARLLALCEDLARLAGARVVQKGAHQFHPRGVTAYVIIAESHISIHTWPESGKAFLDIFTCKHNFEPELVLDYILSKLGGKRGRVTLILRDSLSSRLLVNGRLAIRSITFDFGRPIFTHKSRFQKIELTRGSMGLSLFLDGYWQFVEKYEAIYHETLVHPAMVCAGKLARVGIAGGGDGLAMREVLRHPNLGRAWMYEIDPDMLAVAREHPEMLRLNRNALAHPKACVVAADARRMLRPGADFDVLILDFPSISDGTRFSHLYSVPLYRQARRALSRQGVLVTQVTDFPWNLRRTIANLKQVFPHVVPMEIGFRFTLFNFVVASRFPLRQRRPLPAGLKFLTPQRLNALLTPLPGHRQPRMRGQPRPVQPPSAFVAA